VGKTLEEELSSGLNKGARDATARGERERRTGLEGARALAQPED
jgi:hypothetical protein